MDIFTSDSALNGLYSYFFLSLIVAFCIIGAMQLFRRNSSLKTRRPFGVRSSRYLPLLVIVMSFLGMTVGLTGGWSREGVVGDIIPAVLGVIGGLIVYLFGNRRSKGLVAIPSALAFTVSVFLGFVIGAEIRNPIDRSKAYRDMCLRALSDPKLLSSTDAYCRFMKGAGDHCTWEIFKNTMSYDSSSRYGDAKFDRAWEAKKYKQGNHV
ncbi:MAG: hypothetical protein ABJP82_12205, partial [Hyphomicrobiales bacterium]